MISLTKLLSGVAATAVLLSAPVPAMAQEISIDDTVLESEDPPLSGFLDDVFGETGEALVAPELEYGVVSAAHPDASFAGMQILQQGGSSVDAAMAMMLVLSVVEPQSSGIGGGGFLVQHEAASGGVSTIDGRETAPSRASPDRFLGPDGKPLPFMEAVAGGKSVGVPGNVSLMAKAHKKWGKLPWADVVLPAIQLADGGFIVSKSLAERLEQLAPYWKDFPEARKIYWIDGRPAREGEEIRNPALSATLQRIADRGPQEFYAGQTGQEIVRVVTRSPINPGDISRTDLTAYSALERDAVCRPYRTYKICGMGPPSSGATTVLQMLGMLEKFDLEALGPDNMESWHLIGEAMQLAYADRDTYLGDPAFVTVPVEGMLDREYLDKRAKLISPTKSLLLYEAGAPAFPAPKEEESSLDADDFLTAESSEVPGTTHFVALDTDGNLTSMTSTIEGPFGSQLIAGGFFLNNELTDFTFSPMKDGKLVANSVAGFKRPLSSMSPTIVYNAEGKPVMALGSAGGRRIIMHVAKTLIGAIDFGLPLEEAMALPNIYYRGGKLLVEDGTFLAENVDKLAEYGQSVEATDLGSKLNGAEWSEATGWVGAADPRSDGEALAE